jgi:chromosome segregation ATPase
MGCGGFHELFRVYDSRYDSRNTGYNNRHQDDTQEKISLIKRLYAEGSIDRDRYYSLKDRAYNGNLSFEQLMDIKESSFDSRENSSQDEDKPNNKNKSINKYKRKIRELKSSKEKVESIRSKIKERLNELLQEKEKTEEMAESMVSSSEEVAREYIEKKLDLEENIQVLKKREKELENQIDEIGKTMKVIDTKLLDYEAVKLQEELEDIKKDI